MKKENKNIDEKLDRGEIAIYQNKDKGVIVEANLKEDTIWLTQAQITDIFGVDRSVITKHIRNIFKDGELEEKSNVQKMHIANSDKLVNFYNLDMILSVGYRVNSKQATQFRVWATKTLKEHIIKGYTLNSKRLEELKGKQLNEFEQAIGLIKKTIDTKILSGGEESGLLKVITEYANSWLLLQRYDEDGLTLPRKVKKPTFSLKYDFAQLAIFDLKRDLMKKGNASELFGTERSSLQGIIGNIYQTFGGSELYSSIEEKAAHLLYFVIKDHPFADGNKRIGSFLFIVFLAQNKHLFRKNGDKKINDNALVAVALLVAESEPSHKDTLIKLITNLISD
ncbi:MAG: putative Death-on-curing family protein [Parcubacteria group bacterium GW2011_GWF2_38_76]|nr:MAG: putative Death-on-curing family protein [Parcubacteria group bacterium GW2011_GWF2_38_76]HBM45787.1 hypothetical protein [Patescibacteria group bacterium]